ncbi:hypothetical protein ASE01_17530 [Nocardioides sp. Root190]|uniref:hypothetical protein n=1 Tax=Nocardioides sp. Root190 TaxID=1736488 RepID=UPI0006F882F7|nr:hypothetical protein [Nocardioides sp. Root190]KRB73820.1 hypothetical protein ASE01_17530 [Nocardioides sp. Root190]
MTGNSTRRAAQEKVMSYHEAQLEVLVRRVAAEVDRFRAGEVDAFDVDQVIFQYSRAAKELWKFCNLDDVEFTASLVDDQRSRDWWQRGEPKRR